MQRLDIPHTLNVFWTWDLPFSSHRSKLAPSVNLSGGPIRTGVDRTGLDPDYGRATAVQIPPRIIQVGLEFNF